MNSGPSECDRHIRTGCPSAASSLCLPSQKHRASTEAVNCSPNTSTLLLGSALLETRPKSALLVEDPLAIPANAALLLQRSLDDQEAAAEDFALKDQLYQDGERRKRARVQMLCQQQARRQALDLMDVRASQKTADMLDEVLLAVRDRRISLLSDGYQAFVFSNNDAYEGEWKGTTLHGRGCLRRQNANDVYEGQWFLGQRNGTGTYHSGTFSILYHGSWLDGKRHGKGELLEPEGVFTGEFVDNAIQGYGEYIYNDGHVYKGEWVRGIYEGTGTYLYPSGTRYEGSWRQGYECGRGAKTFFNGDTYVGEWKHGQPNGFGSYSTAFYTYEGGWEYGEMHGFGLCRYKDGSYYEGWWHRGRYHGEGVFHSADGTITYTGGFVDGRREGDGEYESEHVYYTGGWKRDMKHGVGTMSLRNGGKYSGTWNNDVHVSRSIALVDDSSLLTMNGVSNDEKLAHEPDHHLIDLRLPSSGRAI